MLKTHHYKRKISIGALALVVPILSACSFTYLTFTPAPVHAATDTRTLDDIDFMQEITPTICSNTPIADEAGHNQYHLKDSRDKDTNGKYKEYWVAHLKDGNCWMTQNLDLDIPATGLKASDTDLTTDWNSSSTYKPVATQATDAGPSGFSGTNTVASYDPGIKYCSENTTNQCNLTTSSHNGHDAVGNYYSWTAATAGTGVGKDNNGDIAPSSICPKGWKLPLSGDKNGSNNTISGSFKYLVDIYDINNNAAGSTTLRSAPLYFVYGGFVNSGALSYPGSGGGYWSSIADSPTNADCLSLNSSTVHPSNTNARYLGRSVRCVAPGLPQKDTNISVTIPPILTIDATSNMDETVGADGIATGTISATIIANTEYDVKLSSEHPNLSNGSDTINTIKPVSTNDSSLTNNTWGIRTSGSGSTALYSPITTTPTNFLNASSTNANGDTVHTYDIGVKTAPSLPAGTYSTTVTITASTK